MANVGGDISKLELNSNASKVPDQDSIGLYKDYSIEDLDNLYNNKNKIMRINIDSENTDLAALGLWMMNNQEAYLILRTDEEGTELLEEVKNKYPHLRNRYIAEIDDTKKHYLIQRSGYKNIILNTIDQEYADEEIIDFLKLYEFYGVIMDESRGETDLPKKLKEIGVKPYIEDKDSGELRLYK